MNTPRVAIRQGGVPWLAPLAAGITLVLAAFAVASFLIGSDSEPDPLAQIISDLEAQVRADPGSAGLRVTVADAYLKDGRPAEALSQYEEALRIDANREDAIFGMGLAYREQGQLDLARAAFATVIEMNADNPMQALNRRLQGAHYYLGVTLREQGLYDEAINELRIALGLNRADADTLVELGRTFALKGENEDAAAAYEIALAFVPDYTEAYRELEQLALTMNDDAKARFARAMVTVIEGQPEKAVPDLRQAAEQGNSSRYWWGLGFALEKSGETGEAIAAYEKAVEINPGELLAAESLQRLKKEAEP